MSAREDLETVIIYGINPRPFYKNAEQIRLTENYEAAVKEAEHKNKELEDIRACKQNLEAQQTQEQEQLKQLQFREAEQIQQIQELEQKRQELERTISAYKSHTDSINKLQNNFYKVSTPIRALISQGKKMFEDVASLDESIKDLKFPSLEVIPSVNGNGKLVERPKQLRLSKRKLRLIQLSSSGSLVP
ncbi:MAG: hypothetical protein KME49_14960 [Brasilonema octagenarum HA4186-MV1]|jgi:DNA repair exonuclease SbcCD ATPase subunit|nr:hypothetical protein [Brasilonema octagenarum HA4186-MV1]